METNILKIELTATRLLDDNTPDRLTASIGIPVEADDEAINDALNDELMVFAVGALHDLVAFMRPEWLDGEETGLTAETYFGDSKCQTCKGVVAMNDEGYSFKFDD